MLIDGTDRLTVVAELCRNAEVAGIDRNPINNYDNPFFFFSDLVILSVRPSFFARVCVCVFF